jgi:hypothetical protein
MARILSAEQLYIIRAKYYLVNTKIKIFLGNFAPLIAKVNSTPVS